MSQTFAPPFEAPQPHRLWRIWLLFFCQYAAIGIYFTYINLFFRSTGLSGTQIGLLNMCTALVGVGGSVFWGYLSDRTGKPRLIIAIGALGAMLAAQLFPYLYGFWPLLMVASLGSLLGSSPGALTDSTALVILGSRREDYGKFRVGGSLGYIFATLTAGFVFEQTGLKVMFPAYGVAMIALALAALTLPPVKTHLHSSGSNEIGRMIRRPAWLVFIICVFLVWVAFNGAILFLGISLSAMGANQGLIGVATTISAVAELPFMFFSGSFLRRFGPERLMMAAMGLSVVRFFLLSWMPAPGWAVAINVLNGPGFVLFSNSTINYANKMAPPGLAGTAQGLVAAAISLAAVASSLLSGWLFDQIGSAGIFEVMGAIVVAALLLFSVGSFFNRSSLPVEPAASQE